MNSFAEHYNDFFNKLGKARIMVLSTSENDKTTSRMMSIINLNQTLYFQTDKTFRKYAQLKQNPNVALCIENIQIEGVCEEVGRPADNIPFCEVYKESFANSYKRYTFMENERLFAVKPTYIERWLYIDNVPFMEITDVEKQTYELIEYKCK